VLPTDCLLSAAAAATVARIDHLSPYSVLTILKSRHPHPHHHHLERNNDFKRKRTKRTTNE
jgi:hypothetical protein